MPHYNNIAPGAYSNPSNWSPTPPAGGPGLNGADLDTITINHDVTHDRAGITWLGTGVAGNVAVQINAGGALRMSRTTSGTLRLWGHLRVAATGIFDSGTIASPIPAGITATTQFRSTSNAFGLDALNDSETYFVGTATRRRWTRLIAAVSTGNVIRVADATGWQVNDPIVFASSLNAFNSPHMTRISGITQNSPTDWSITLAANVNTNYAQRKPIGNLGANVHLHAVRPTSPFEDDWDLRNAGLAGSAHTINNETTARANTRVFRSMRFGIGGAGGTAMLDIRNTVAGSLAWARLIDVAFASWGGNGITFATQNGRWECENSVVAMNAAFTAGAFTWQNNGVGWEFDDCLIAYGVITNGNGSLLRQRWRRCHWGGTFDWQPSNSISWSDALFEDCEFGVPGSNMGSMAAGTGATFLRCRFGIPFAEDNVRGFMEGTPTLGFMPAFNRTAAVEYRYIDCRWAAAHDLNARYALNGPGWPNGMLSPATRIIIANYNENPNDQRIYTPDGRFVNDTATFRSASPALRYIPYTSGRAQSLSFDVLAPNAQPVPVSGFVRRDAAAISAGGTVTARIEGPGVAPVTHTSAGAADAWEQFAFNVVQSTGTDATLTATLTFQATAGSLWADDLVAPASVAVTSGGFGFWARGQPLGAIFANFAAAADVWSIPLANLATPGSVGDALRNVEGGLDLRAVMRLLLAEAIGNVTGAPGTPAFRSLDGTKTRVGGTADDQGNRTRTITDAT